MREHVNLDAGLINRATSATPGAAHGTLPKSNQEVDMTQPHAPTVAVAGATGLIGQALLSRLAGDVRARDVHALARRPPAEHGAVQWHDWEWLNLPDALPALDLAFCCLGTTRRQAGSRDAFEAVDHALVLRFARAMRAAGVRNFSVVSSAGASAQDPGPTRKSPSGSFQLSLNMSSQPIRSVFWLSPFV